MFARKKQRDPYFRVTRPYCARGGGDHKCSRRHFPRPQGRRHRRQRVGAGHKNLRRRTERQGSAQSVVLHRIEPGRARYRRPQARNASKDVLMTKKAYILLACLILICAIGIGASAPSSDKEVHRLMEQQNRELKRIADAVEVLAGKRR